MGYKGLVLRPRHRARKGSTPITILTSELTLVISTQGWKKKTLQWTAANLWQSLASGIGQTYWLYFVSESWQQWWHVKVVIVNVCRPQWISGSVMDTAKKSAHSPTWTSYSSRHSSWFSKTALTLPSTVAFVYDMGLWIVCCHFPSTFIGPGFSTIISSLFVQREPNGCIINFQFISVRNFFMFRAELLLIIRRYYSIYI